MHVAPTHARHFRAACLSSLHPRARVYHAQARVPHSVHAFWQAWETSSVAGRSQVPAGRLTAVLQGYFGRLMGCCCRRAGPLTLAHALSPSLASH